MSTFLTMNVSGRSFDIHGRAPSSDVLGARSRVQTEGQWF